MRISDVTKEKHMNEKDAIKSAKFITSLLDRLGIEYWFDYGALLGTIRNQKFIPWDTDIEINFKYKHEFEIEVLKGELLVDFDYEVNPYYIHIKEKEGYVGMSLSWFRETELTRIISLLSYYIPKQIRKAIIKTIQELYCKSTNEIMRPDDGLDREKSWHCRAIRQMLPIFFCGKLRKVKLYDFEVNVPAKAEELLLLRYGEDWKVPMKRYRSYTT